MPGVISTLLPATRSVEYIAAFELEGRHEFKFEQRWNPIRNVLFPIKLDVFIDKKHVLDESAGAYTFGVRRKNLEIEESVLELVWKMNYVRGGSDYMVLVSGKKILAKYGRERAIKRLGLLTGPDGETSEIFRLKIGADKVESTTFVEVDREEFPLDNSHGSDVLSVEQEVTRSVTSTLEVSKDAELTAKLGASVLSLVEIEIGGKLSSRVSETIGQTASRRQQLEFHVKPGDNVVYTVIWKKRVRKGTYQVMINGAAYELGYEASFGLSVEVSSRTGASPAVNSPAPASEPKAPLQ